MIFNPVLQAYAPKPVQAGSTGAATPVLITDQDLDPSEVSVPVGSAVVWTNSTDEHTQALWHFDETSGSTTFMDASSYANHLIGYGGAQTYQP